MQHFVKVIHGYLALQVTQVSWQQFQTDLETVQDLDGLYKSHHQFILRCLSRYELISSPSPVLVMNLSHSVYIVCITVTRNCLLMLDKADNFQILYNTQCVASNHTRVTA